MEQPATILEKILEKLEDINLAREEVVAKERADPDREVSGWADVNPTPLQLFIEYVVTNRLGYHDSFYWNPPDQKLSGYEKIKNKQRLREIKDEWSGIDPRQTPYIPPLKAHSK
jgi:hypothetical protein